MKILRGFVHLANRVLGNVPSQNKAIELVDRTNKVANSILKDESASNTPVNKTIVPLSNKQSKLENLFSFITKTKEPASQVKREIPSIETIKNCQVRVKRAEKNLKWQEEYGKNLGKSKAKKELKEASTELRDLKKVYLENLKAEQEAKGLTVDENTLKNILESELKKLS